MDSQLPDLIQSLNLSEKGQRVKEIRQNTFLLDDQIVYFKVHLDIGIKDGDSAVRFSIYCSASKPEYKEALSAYMKGQKSELVSDIANYILFYNESFGLKAKVVFNPELNYFQAFVIDDSEIKNNQNHFISEDQLLKMHELFYHDFGKDEIVDSPCSFEEFEVKALKLLKADKPFFTDVIVNKVPEILLQILSHHLLETNEGEGFGIYLANDDTFLSYEFVKLFMESDSFLKGFKKYEEEGIEVYKKHFGLDFKNLQIETFYIMEKLTDNKVKEYYLSINVL